MNVIKKTFYLIVKFYIHTYRKEMAAIESGEMDCKKFPVRKSGSLNFYIS